MPERNKNRAPYTLVEMLRLIPRSSLPIGVAWNKCEEAADRIEELETRIAEKEAALQDIASGRYSNVILPTHPPQDPAVVRARAALEGGRDNGTL